MHDSEVMCSMSDESSLRAAYLQRASCEAMAEAAAGEDAATLQLKVTAFLEFHEDIMRFGVALLLFVIVCTRFVYVRYCFLRIPSLCLKCAL